MIKPAVAWACAICVLCGCICGCAADRMAAATADSKLGGLAWMAGTWRFENDGMTSEEHWIEPRGGTMFGVNRSVRGGSTEFYEYLCIEHTPDGIFYLASPSGRQPPTPFRLVENVPSKMHGYGRVVFENPEHDFPQRIVYQRQGDMMHAWIEGVQDGQPRKESWTWRWVK